MSLVVDRAGEVDELGDLAELDRQPAPGTVLLADPTHYDVTREDNPHVTDAEGRLNEVDPDRARRQWAELEAAYERLGLATEVVPAEPGLPDLVFCRNSVFPYRDPAGQPCFVPGRMRYEGREGEVPVASRHLEGLGYEATPLPPGVQPFECGGDLVWLGRRRLVLAGTGDRTSPKALEAAARVVDAPFVALELVDPAFYHLDTCLAALDGETIAWVPAAFAERSRELVDALPVEAIEVPEAEARATLAANLHCPDGDNVVIDEANAATIDRLEAEGYAVHPVDTSEFRKAGGSVFCLTNDLW